jgi:NRAMP (natural resistance-associated macrophage protein)-like metal ion transporter
VRCGTLPPQSALPAAAAGVRSGRPHTIPHGGPPPGVSPDGAAPSGEQAQRRGLAERARRTLRLLGPGVISGASNDDPSAIGTYAQAGAAFGFATLWVAPLALPMMATAQFIAAKIGMVSGMGLAGVLRQHYPRWLLYPVVLALVVANTINAGADLGAIAAGLNLLVPIPTPVLVVPVTLGILAVQVWGSYRLIATVFKWITLVLFAYVAAGLLAKPDLREVLLATLIPSFPRDGAFVSTLVAMVGTTLSPYLHFWQASQQVEEEVAKGRVRLWQRRGATRKEIEHAAIDVRAGMFFACLVMYFILLSTAATLFKAGQHEVATAADAAEALRPVAGDAATMLFAVGLIGAGMLAVPVLTTGAAYALAEAAGWRYGLNEEPKDAKQFYATIAALTLVGMALNYVGVNPITALVWAATINGLLAPVLLVVLLVVSNDRRVMGSRANGKRTNTLGALTALAAMAAAAGLVVTWVTRS